MKYIKTYITLPPGMLSLEQVQEFFRMAFETYKWFSPRRYGFGVMNNLVPGEGDYSTLLEHFQRRRVIMVAAETDQDFLLLAPARLHDRPYIGRFTWATALKATRNPSWRETHVLQVVELMKFFRSPVAFAAVPDDLWQKTNRLVEMGHYQEEVFTVRDYSEGLAGLFWRNFYGPPFVRLFGEQLNSLPPECVTHLGEERVLVQPYELPTEAGTEAARAREQQLISLLGPECFYDHEHHRPPTRRPVLEREEPPALS